jgi:hypothetical protein
LAGNGRCCFRLSACGPRTRSFPGAKYPKSSPPALPEPRDAANQMTKTNSMATL